MEEAIDVKPKSSKQALRFKVNLGAFAQGGEWSAEEQPGYPLYLLDRPPWTSPLMLVRWLLARRKANKALYRTSKARRAKEQERWARTLTITDRSAFSLQEYDDGE